MSLFIIILHRKLTFINIGMRILLNLVNLFIWYLFYVVFGINCITKFVQNYLFSLFIWYLVYLVLIA